MKFSWVFFSLETDEKNFVFSLFFLFWLKYQLSGGAWRAISGAKFKTKWKLAGGWRHSGDFDSCINVDRLYFNPVVTVVLFSTSGSSGSTSALPEAIHLEKYSSNTNLAVWNSILQFSLTKKFKFFKQKLFKKKPERVGDCFRWFSRIGLRPRPCVGTRPAPPMP